MKRKMLTRALSVLTAAAMLTCVWGCGGEDGTENAGKGSSAASVNVEPIAAPVQEEPGEEPAQEPEAEEEIPTIPDDMYASELTGLPISRELAMQRPIAVMVDNEVTALPHFGTSDGDIVYEMVNSTKNNRITRLMVLLKDWESIEQMGSIRSTRPTNIMLAAEYNAVLCHDGGPVVHITPYFNKGFVDHFSGTFSRVNNGKSREYTEYILPGDLDKNFGDSVSRDYKDGFSPDTPHFNFVEYGTKTDLASLYERTYPTKQIILPFPHNSSLLLFNDDTREYEYYEYGDQYFDEGNGEPLSFTNVILQRCSFTKLDEEGYLVYNVLGTGDGFYITDGLAKSISWVKNGDQDFTRFYDDNGQEIAFNRGKTYIAIVPDDTWDKVQMNAEIYQ